jgi:hypothetical protein
MRNHCESGHVPSVDDSILVPDPPTGCRSTASSGITRPTPAATPPESPSLLPPIRPILVSEWDIGPDNETEHILNYFNQSIARRTIKSSQ